MRVAFGDNIQSRLSSVQQTAAPSPFSDRTMSNRNRSQPSQSSSSRQRSVLITKPKYIIPTQVADKVQLVKPVAVAVSPPDGKIIVADQELSQLIVFDRKYKFIRVIGRHGDGECQFDAVRAVGVSTDGEIVVADSGNSRIQVLTSGGQFATAFGREGRGVGEFREMSDVAVDSQNRIYVCDSGNGRIQIMDLQGRFIREFGCSGNKTVDVPHPQAISVCPSTGNIILADTANRRIQVFYATGKHRLTVGWGGSESDDLLEPVSVTAGPDWTVYVADPTQGRVCVYKSDGSLVKEIGHNGNLDNGEQFEPRYLAINRETKELVVVDSLNKRVIVFKE